MSPDEFAAALERHFVAEGYAVERLAGEDADLELTGNGRVLGVACRRWKATRAGIEPLRQLHALSRKRQASQCIYVAAGEVTEQARDFAARSNIRFVEGAELARLKD
jgi:restriction system protein